MIDTIVLRIHNLEKYSRLVDYILEDRKGVSHGMAMEKDITALRFRYIHFTETNNSMMSYRTYIKTPSHNYDVMIALVQFRDYIEISLSVPKFLYGNNVLMFTKHHQDTGLLDLNEQEDMAKVLDETFGMLSDFIGGLWNKLFPDYIEVEKQDVELKRLDICYNQVFNSEYDAKMYLMYQKMIKKRGARETSESLRSYETSIFYSTEYYAAKIYHKGTEYRKHDMTKHIRANKKARQDVFPIFDKGTVQGIASCADRILRYELSFRKSFLQYYYWRYYYRKDVELVRKRKNIHRLMVNDQVGIDRCGDKEKLKLLIEAFRKKYSSDHSKIQKDVQRLYDTAPTFMLAVRPDWVNEQESEDYFFNQKGQMCFDRKQPFTKFLYNQMCQTFLEFFENFQVKEKVSFNASVDRVIEYNKKCELDKKLGVNSKKMKVGSMKKTNLLLQHYSMDELKELGTIPKRTYYYWKKRLGQIGIDNKNVASVPIYAPRGKRDYLFLVLHSRLSECFKK